MSNKKVEKKKRRLLDRIEQLENELKDSLTKKDSATAEISVGDQQRKIAQLKKEYRDIETKARLNLLASRYTLFL